MRLLHRLTATLTSVLLLQLMLLGSGVLCPMHAASAVGGCFTCTECGTTVNGDRLGG